MTLALAILLTLQDPSDPNDKVGHGILSMPSLSLLNTLRGGLEPRVPEPLPKGTFELDYSLTWANTWGYNDGSFYVDQESLVPMIALGWGATDRTRIEVEARAPSRFGGRMDSLIEVVHEVFKVEAMNREDFPEDEFRVELLKEGKTAELEKSDRGFYGLSATGTVQSTIWEGNERWPMLSGSFTLRTDMGPNRDLREGSLVDVGASLSAAHRIGDFHFYGALGAAWYGTERFQHVKLRPVQGSLLLAAEWRFSSGASLVAQYLITKGAARNWRNFSRPSNEIALGLRLAVAANARLELGVIENLADPVNAPDFGLHAGMELRF